MKKWTNAEIVELDITATAYGKNLNAREANANKHSNNGAGGSLNNNPPIPGGEEDKAPVTPVDSLS